MTTDSEQLVDTEADRIRDYLAALGMSQREAAKELKIDERMFRYYCAGKENVPPVIFLALRHLIQMQKNDRCLALLGDGTMSTSDGAATAERLQRANEALRAANALLLKCVQASPEELIGDCIQSLDRLMENPTQSAEQIQKIRHTLDHFRARFTGMLDRGSTVQGVAERYGLTEEYLRKFLADSNMAHVTDLVDLLVPSEHERATSNALFEWQKLQGENSMLETVGDTGEGRKQFIDIPVAAVEYVRQRGIPCESVPRDPRRPIFR
jgi:transcriptional regulator with XRE-family HTH domain